MKLSSGTRLGPYEITAPIGAGGMGEVYKARDTRLDRTVAIKVMSSAAATPDGLARFQVEARAIAALAHPNICALFDVGHQNDIDYLVMEFLDGETLGQRLKRSGPLPVDQALNRAIEIADALDKAHSHGVTHRDLKPANVFLVQMRRASKSSATHARHSDQVMAKLLDFGLAKLHPPEEAIAELNRAETQGPETSLGAIVGTLNYMSPEQADAQPVDARTDIFAFGALLYEMLTARKAFDGKSAAAVLGAIMERQPEPLGKLVPGLPPGVEFAVNRCLVKNPDERWQSARDLRAHLQHTVATLSATAVPVRTARTSAVWAIAAVAAAVAIVLALALWRAPAPNTGVKWLSALPPRYGFGAAPAPALSPDGRQLAFTAPDETGETVLWLRSLDSLAVQALPGTEGAIDPFWSPDGRSLGVFSQGRLKRIDPSGGLPHVLADASNPRGGTWNGDGDIVFVPNPNSGLFRVPAKGGPAVPIATPGTSPGALLQGYPRFMPDGQRVLFFTLNDNASRSGIFVLDIRNGQTMMVSPILSRAEFAVGRLFFSRDGSLFAQPFDPASATLSGEPVRLVDDVGRSGGASRFNFAFSVANDGTLAYWSGTTMPVTQLTWFDRTGRAIGTVGAPEVYHGFDLSPDGAQGVVERMDPRTTITDLRLIDLTRSSGAATPFITAAEGHVVNTPLWSPDGKSVLYAETSTELFLRDVVSGERKAIPTDAGAKWPTSWSPDGKYIVMDRTTTVGQLWVLPATGGKAYPYLSGTHSAQGAHVSPDGRWLTYRSDETGEYEIYVDSFPRPGRKVRVSVSGGSRPRWRRDGRELYFIGRDHRLMAVTVDPTGDRVRVNDPQALFAAPALNLSFTRTQYIASPDGQRFLFNAQVEDPSRGGISIGVGLVAPGAP